MSKGNPAEEGDAQPATSRAGTGAAAGVGMGNTESRSGPKPQVDEYDELLTALGRTEEQGSADRGP